MADKSTSLPELVVIASRAWLAAGEEGHARHFARQVVDDASAPDNVRLMALEILESTSKTGESIRPPPEAPIHPMPIVMAVPNYAERERSAPAGASLPPFTSEPGNVPVLEPSPSQPVEVEVAARVDRVEPGEPTAREAPTVLDADSLPTIPIRPRTEIVESLPLPPGANEDMLPVGARPQSALEARVAMIRMARELGRDYRLWYGTTLKTNATAIEAMQRHLRRRFDDEQPDEKSAQKLEAELTRHGALLSEILARSLGARWVDLTGNQPGHWAMMVPPKLRVWPIGRVYRFFQQGHRESDLVAFYLDLENKANRQM